MQLKTMLIAGIFGIVVPMSTVSAQAADPNATAPSAQRSLTTLPPAGVEAAQAPPVRQSPGARIRTVASADELHQAVAHLQPGDVIEVQDGDYRDVEITLPSTLHGTADAPIILRARTAHKAIFTGPSYIQIAGRHIIVQGLAFRDANVPWGTPGAVYATTIHLGGDHNRVTGCRFDRCGDGGENAWRHIVHVPNTSSDSRVDSNQFYNSRCIPTGLQSGGTPQHNAFTHNLIDGNDPSAPNNFRVAIQIGQGGPCDERTLTLVEYNTIRHFDGPESVGIKSSACIIRHNLVTDSAAPLGVRAGNDNQISGNVMLHCRGGIMLTGRAHTVEGNYVLLDRKEGGLGALFLHHEAWKDGQLYYQPTIECVIRNNVLMVLAPNDISPVLHAFAWLPDVRSVPRGNRFENNTIIGHIGGHPTLTVWDQASKRTTAEDFVKANTFINNRFWLQGATSPQQVQVPADLVGRDGNRIEDPHLP